jgi:hypothetical protein
MFWRKKKSNKCEVQPLIKNSEEQHIAQIELVISSLNVLIVKQKVGVIDGYKDG